MHEEFKIFRVKRVLLTEYVEKRLIQLKQCGTNGPRASTGGRGGGGHKYTNSCFSIKLRRNPSGN